MSDFETPSGSPLADQLKQTDKSAFKNSLSLPLGALLVTSICNSTGRRS